MTMKPATGVESTDPISGSVSHPPHHVGERLDSTKTRVRLVERHSPRLEQRKADEDAPLRRIDDRRRIAAWIGRGMKNLFRLEVDLEQGGPAPRDGRDLLATVRVAEERDIPRASVRRRERDVCRLVQRVPRREQLGFVDDQTPAVDQAAGEYRLAVQAASVHP